MLMVAGAAVVMAETITMTTYLPVPRGSFSYMALEPQAGALTGACPAVGTLGVDNTGTLRYCGTGLTWSSTPGVWTQNGDLIYLSDTGTPAAKKVGIGTSSPQFKLSLDNDGGIYAKGAFGSGATITSDSTSPKFIWHPGKAALRAGYSSVGGWSEANIGNYSIVMGKDNNASSDNAAILGGEFNGVYPPATHATVTGGKSNTVYGDYGFMGGGEGNLAYGNHNVLSGGLSNVSNGLAAVIAGGENNTITNLVSNYGTISGGRDNTVSGHYATISGGYANVASGYLSTVSGGGGSTASEQCPNRATNSYAVVAGGTCGQANGANSFVGSGLSNLTAAAAQYAVAVGGRENHANAASSAILGGRSNTTDGIASTIGGGWLNQATGDYSVVGGGGHTSAAAEGNIAAGENSTISGGRANRASANYTTVGGGLNNVVDAGALRSTIGGGANNTINANMTDSTIAGGMNNIATLRGSVIGGGSSNQAISAQVTIAGGSGNIAGDGNDPGEYGATVGGGASNTAQAMYSTIVGGYTNDIQVSGDYSVVGGFDNTASGFASTIPGGEDNMAHGDYSFAAGRFMQLSATADRTFVWGNAAAPYSITTADAALFFPNSGGIGSTGRVGIGTATPRGKLDVNGNMFIKMQSLSSIAPITFRWSTSDEVGYDVAELFETTEIVEAGDLLVIDENTDVRLKKSGTPYDKTVAGIVSGAPAILFEGSELQMAPEPYKYSSGTKVPLTLSGRIMCKVSTENGPIKRGDLLTSSSTPGHAMKATDPAKIPGSIVGKALQPFEGGPDGETTGGIMVLLTLQ